MRPTRMGMETAAQVQGNPRIVRAALPFTAAEVERLLDLAGTLRVIQYRSQLVKPWLSMLLSRSSSVRHSHAT